MAGFGLFLYGPVILRIKPRTLCRLIFKVLILLLSRGVVEESADPRLLPTNTDLLETPLFPIGAVTNPLALTTQD